MKHTLKQKILYERQQLTKEEIRKKSEAVMKNLYSLPEYKEAKNIMFYVSVESEVDTQGTIKDLLKQKKKTIIIPYVVKNNTILQLSQLQDFNDLEKKTFGILEPKGAYIRKFNPEKLDLIIIPGLVFAKDGHRIGYGHGYYDRFLKTLKHKPNKIGLAYDFQIVDKITYEKHDVPMDMIVSEKRVMHCNKGK